MGKIYTTLLWCCFITFLFNQLVWAQIHFTFTTSDDYYSIIVNEAFIEGQALQNGDEIGVFFNNSGTLVCAGAVIWPNPSLCAWSDDSQTDAKDGFIPGETLVFKIWDAGAASEYSNVNASFLTGNGTWGNGVYAQVNLNTCPYTSEPDIDIQDNLHFYTFPETMVGTYAVNAFLIENTGNTVLNVTSISISGTNAGNFSIITGGKAVFIKPDSIHVFNVQFDATATGESHATLAINSNDPDENPWQIEMTGLGVENTLPHFFYPVTDDYYSIIVGKALIDGQPLQNGDEIGVFFNNSGTLVCAGAVIWPNFGISAWGDDPETSWPDGFATGDSLYFKIWDKSAAAEFSNVNAAFTTGNGTWGDGVYAQVNFNLTTAIHTLPEKPIEFALLHNYPNPFNPQTNIEFSVPEITDVMIAIYNVTGQKIRTLVNEKMPQGSYHLTWDGTDDNRAVVSAGIYFLCITADKFAQTVKMALIK